MMRFLQDVVVRGGDAAASAAAGQNNVFEEDDIVGDDDAVSHVFEILGTIGGTLIAVRFVSLCFLDVLIPFLSLGFLLSAVGVV